MTRCSTLQIIRMQIKIWQKDHFSPKVVTVSSSKRSTLFLARLWQQPVSWLLMKVGSRHILSDSKLVCIEVTNKCISDPAMPFLKNVAYRTNQASTNLANETIICQSKWIEITQTPVSKRADAFISVNHCKRTLQP